MTDLDYVKLVGKANTNTLLPAGNAVDRAIEVTRDGSLFVADYKLKLALQGRVFVVNAGTVTTPLTFLVTAANRPDVVLRVPSGTTVMPLVVETVLEAAAGTATELDVRMASNDIGSGTSSAASVGPLNLRSDGPVTSAVTARQLYTADATAETTPISLHRKTWPLAQATGLEPYVDYWMPDVPPILVGPASLAIYIAATTTQATGFVQILFAEVPSSWVTN